MFKRVDVEKEAVTGFHYLNGCASYEGVIVKPSSVLPVYTATSEVLDEVLYEDIPKLIKALQAAYDQYLAGDA